MTERNAGHAPGRTQGTFVFGVIRSPSLDVIASVGAAIQKRRHDLTLFFFLAGKSERCGLRKGSHAREPGADREPGDGLF